jgi:hypothetical protein
MAAFVFATGSFAAIGPAAAQFMFMDTDGDGAYTSSDDFGQVGNFIDIYLDTRNLDGSDVTCSDGSPLTFYAFNVNLQGLESAIASGTVSCEMPGMHPLFPAAVHRYAVAASYAGTQSFPPGKYRLLHMELDFEEYCAAMAFSSSSCYSPAGMVTSIETNCPGFQGDFVFRINEDLATSPGFAACTDLLGPWPDLTCPDHVDGIEGQPLSIPMALFDSDCNIFSFYVSDLPPGAAFSGLAPFRAGVATGVVTWTPAVGQAGNYAVRYDASEYPNWFHMVTQRDECTTTVSIRPASTGVQTRDLAARVFSAPGDSPTRVPGGRSMTWFHVEPSDGVSFDPDDVLPATVTLRAEPGCAGGESHQIAKAPVTGRDTDQNGIREYRAGFTGDALARLVGCLPPGNHDVNLTLSGGLANGDRFQGRILHTFILAGRSLAVRVLPNPLGPTSTLAFTTFSDGLVTARLFDIRGRFVATLLGTQLLSAGPHHVPLASIGQLRSRLASGVYFVTVTTERDGSVTRAVTILK